MPPRHPFHLPTRCAKDPPPRQGNAQPQSTHSSPAGATVTPSLLPLTGLLLLATLAASAAPSVRDLAAQVGQPADIAPGAYLYRADRPATQSPPESWIGLMQYAGLPYDRPVGADTPALKPVLCGLLWEEVRPLRQLILTWPAGARRPEPADLVVSCFDATDDTAHTWWNPRSLRELATPEVSAGGLTYTYAVPVDTWGVFVARRDGKPAAGWTAPQVHALVPDTWKRMDVEVEWGYEASRANLPYDGHLSAYDGVVAGLQPLLDDAGTELAGARAWRSGPAVGPRRGVRFSLLYMGASTWRRTWPYSAQQEDVARTLVTVRTTSGSFTFLAADLEHGPILAPECGFFVRATRIRKAPAPQARTEPSRELLTTRMDEIPGVPLVRGWASNTIPWLGVNPTDQSGTGGSLTIPARCAAMHPLPDRDVAAGWRSPLDGQVTVTGRLAMADTAGGNGIDWSVVAESGGGREVLAEGRLGTGGAADLPTLTGVSVAAGDMLSLVTGPRDRNHVCDTTLVELAITEEAGQGRRWSLTRDVVDDIHAGNPHADSAGNPDVWWFYSPPPQAETPAPPFDQSSRATSARAYLQELSARGLTTIRERTRAHAEQTWAGAVQAMRPGEALPPHPTPELYPAMRVSVPDARLTAQWNLGAWHILRRSLQDAGGKWRFNDYPFGILASETYLILRALDLQGMHREAANGLDQWLSLPLKHNITPGEGGQHPWSRPDRPLGHFSDGDGCLTLAEGIEGAGGHMDGVHCMGPGAIMFALAEHYRLSGDDAWLRAAAPRIRANAEWILRQRRLLPTLVPGGERLWSKGLQPAHVVTPDSMCMYQQYYESEAYYWLGVKATAELLAHVDPAGARHLAAEAEAYRQDLVAAVDRSIALTPVVAVRDGTYHSFIPFAPYVRGFASGAWGWRRCQGHVGALYWDTVQSADPLISPAAVVAATDPRAQGHLDVLEDRLLLEGPKVRDRMPSLVADRDWFDHASWQYQCGLERHANIHLAAGDAPCFIRSWLNQYAVDIMPGEYTFREHTVGGPPDKLFEESAFLERFRMMLVMEDGDTLWLARATPREWLAPGQRIKVTDAPTHFGPLSYEIAADGVGGITATVTLPSRNPAGQVMLCLRRPDAAPVREVRVNGKPWDEFDAARETLRLTGLSGTVTVEVRY
jgi:hypothetical protein